MREINERIELELKKRKYNIYILTDSQEGLMIERDMALSFSDGDGNELRLRVTGKIWRSIEQNPEGEVFG
ncbi:hypothetical protein Hanom_Chr11g01037701 [Helianthus anomalus]